MSRVLGGARLAGVGDTAAAWRLGRDVLEVSMVAEGVGHVRLASAEARWRPSLATELHAPASVVEEDGTWRAELDGLELTLQASPLALRWRSGAMALCADHPTRGYERGPGTFRHRQVRHEGERLYGLGEVSGALERTGRRYRFDPRDALGYDAEWSDPLYKHWPVLLFRRPEGAWGALVYDVPFAVTVDLGAEIHNYLGPFRYVEALGAGVDYYVLAAGDLPELVERLTRLLGRPGMPPRWSLGYLASGMAYADAEDPERALLEFADRCRSEGVPCDGMHLSSGYTLRDGRRYVFAWSDRIADPARLVAGLAERGLRVVANVKPGLLDDHPDYAGLAERGAFLRARDGRPWTGDFWGGQGSFLDFTNAAARRYWRERVTDRLLKNGIAGIWNDNNEFALEEAFTEAGEPMDAAGQMRAMAHASYEACRSWDPRHRPFLVSRSASLGVQRWAQTWSGDNRSEWKTLRFNTAMGLSMGLSGFANVGHDVGGFAGPAPDAELFVRWVQQGVFYPRFVIHSWKTPPTEPWSHPEAFPAVRDAIRWRYRLLPYLYSLFHDHARTGAPLMRPLFYSFDVPEAHEHPFSFTLGDAVLVPGEAFGPGVRSADVWLPGVGGWYDLDGTVHYPSGLRTLSFPLEAVPALVRAGSVLPLAAESPGRAGDAGEVAELRLFPPATDAAAFTELYFDDGESLAYLDGAQTRLRLHWAAHATELVLEVEVLAAGYPLPPGEVLLRLPVGETRPLRVGAGLTPLGAERRRGGHRERLVRWDVAS